MIFFSSVHLAKYLHWRAQIQTIVLCFLILHLFFSLCLPPHTLSSTSLSGYFNVAVPHRDIAQWITSSKCLFLFFKIWNSMWNLTTLHSVLGCTFYLWRNICTKDVTDSLQSRPCLYWQCVHFLHNVCMKK